MSDQLTKAIYKGRGGAHYHGIPARDILESEWEQLTPAQQKQVSNSPLYEMVVRKPASKKKAGE